MSEQNHPYYDIVRNHLTDTITYIDRHLDELDPPIAYGGDRYAQRQLKQDNLKRIDNLKQSRQEAYTARIDWDDVKEGAETFYIGKTAIPERNIYSWASAFGERVYVNPTEPRSDGTVRLILDISLSGQKLRNLYNKYVHSSLKGQLTRAEFTDSLLFKLLQDSHSKLRDIVATIQENQYRIIRSPKDQLLVVQGAPGSGKTSVALHRVAYLLYNYRSETFIPRNILILGPNRMFLGHIAGILPSLGERQVPQKTFDSWIEELLGDKVNYESQEDSLEVLLDPGLAPVVKARHYRNARNKGSLCMTQMLDRYVDHLYAEVLREQTDPLQYTARLRLNNHLGEISATVTRTIDDLRTVLDTVRELPLNTRREAVEERLVRDLVAELRDRFATQIGNPRATAEMLNDQQVKKFREDIQKSIRQYFTEWRSQNVLIAYRRLLRTPDLLRTCGADIFSDWDLELLAQDAPTARIPFRFSDLAALMYLKLSFDGAEKPYEHIVIDEAQDMTPLHFRVLQRYSRGASLTVLGDLGQGIYPQHGIDKWEDLGNAVGGQAVILEPLRESYRSTHQIIDFANAVLRRTGVDKQQHAVPIARSGPAPMLHRYQKRDDLIKDIVRVVQHEREQWQAIAIVCTTAAACRALGADLKQAGLTGYKVLTNRNDAYTGGIAIIPAYLTKGLEFDVVLIADADAETYPADLIHQRLLYVVLTRAAHMLHVHWIGSITPLLDDQIPLVPLTPIFGGALDAPAVTIADYAAGRSGWDVDRCVERLAQTDKLRLLINGKIDPVVLDTLLSTVSTSASTSEDDVIVTLDEQTQVVLHKHVERIEHAADAGVQGALALIELAYGLLRNQLRAAGLDIVDEGIVPLKEQVVLLATLLHALREDSITMSAGRWTTRQSVLQAISEERRKAAEGLLDTFAEHGLIEQQATGKRALLRLSLERTRPLLDLALGYPSDMWDADLIARIDRLSEPFEWNAPLALR